MQFFRKLPHIRVTPHETLDTESVLMEYNASDNVLALTDSGRSAIHAAMMGARVLSVSTEIFKNHLLELKLALGASSYEELCNVFCSGQCCDVTQFEDRLSADAMRYLLRHKPPYAYCNAVKLLSWFRVDAQAALHSSAFRWLLICAEKTRTLAPLAWYAFGIHHRQLQLILEHDCRSVMDYLQSCVHNNSTLVYVPEITKENQHLLSRSVDTIRVSTRDLETALTESTYSKVVLGDIMDRIDGFSQINLVNALESHVKRSGRILLRSVSMKPPYIELLTQAGFTMKLAHSHATQVQSDFVNMYASTWIGYKN